MTDKRREELRLEYLKEAHGVQSGVAFMMNHMTSPTEPKHLRVGVNLTKCDHAALVSLLIEKDIITEEEYMLAIVASARKEREGYEEQASLILGGGKHVSFK